MESKEKMLRVSNCPAGVNADLVILAPQVMLTGAAEFINKKLKKPVTFNFFDSSSNFPLELFLEDFYQACGHAKAVVLHNWIKAESPRRSWEQMAEIAQAIKKIYPKIKLFAFALGGAYETLVHAGGKAEKIYSLADDLIIEALEISETN